MDRIIGGRDMLVGLLLTIIGVWIWLSNLGYLNFKRDWPLILVILGIYLIIDGVLEKLNLKKEKQMKKKLQNLLDKLETGEMSVDEVAKKIEEG